MRLAPLACWLLLGVLSAAEPLPVLQFHATGGPAGTLMVAPVPDDLASTAGRYPVILFQGGTGDTIQKWKDQHEAGKLASRAGELVVISLHRAMRDGRLPPCLVVQIDWGHAHLDAVIAWADANLPTRPERRARVLMGFSGGTEASLRNVLRHPTLLGGWVGLAHPLFFAPYQDQGAQSSALLAAAKPRLAADCPPLRAFAGTADHFNNLSGIAWLRDDLEGHGGLPPGRLRVELVPGVPHHQRQMLDHPDGRVVAALAELLAGATDPAMPAPRPLTAPLRLTAGSGLDSAPIAERDGRRRGSALPGGAVIERIGDTAVLRARLPRLTQMKTWHKDPWDPAVRHEVGDQMPSAPWIDERIALPNGRYEVTLTYGHPERDTREVARLELKDLKGSFPMVHDFLVEEVQVPVQAGAGLHTATVGVTVADGELRVRSGPTASFACLVAVTVAPR